MAKNKNYDFSDSLPPSRPPLTPEARENQMIAYAVDLAEKQLREGTASSQVITHYLRLATVRERLEREKLENENELIQAKKEALQASKRQDKMYEEAIAAMRKYSGNGDPDEY